MLRKTLCSLLTILLLNFLASDLLHATSIEEKQREATEKIKEKVLKRGVGEKARVKVTLADKSKVTGYIQEAGEESFAVVDPKTGSSTTIRYSQAWKVENSGVSKGNKIAIIITVGVAAVAILLVIAFNNIKFGGGDFL